MTYEEYINELRLVVEQAKELFDAVNLHENDDFRKWRQKLTALIIAAEEQNYNVECDVISRDFDLFIAYGPQPTIKERTSAFNRDLQDTINELGTIIEFYNKFGSSKRKEHSSSDSNHQKKLEYPQKVTLSWLVKHAPIGLWVKFAGVLLTAFLLGLGFSQTVAYKNIKQLWETEKTAKLDTQKPNNTPPQPMPKNGAAGFKR